MIRKLKIESHFIFTNDDILKLKEDCINDLIKYSKRDSNKPLTIPEFEDWLDGSGKYSNGVIGQIISQAINNKLFEL